MIRKLLISLLLLVVLAVGATFLYLDRIVTTGIEVVGSQVLGTKVTVASVTISPLNGIGSISGLEIRNPEGFDSDYIFQLEQVEVSLNAASLLSDVIEIESIIITQPEITYETRITTDNVRALLENIGGSGGETATADSEAGKELFIRDFRLLGPQVNLVAAVASAPISLPDIELTDIGTEDNAATVAQVLEVVLSALRRTILEAELPGLDMLREGLENRLQDGIDEAEEVVEDLGNRLRGILDPN
ncbi:MAG: AsmA family protein [Pseudomonadales bacterium]|nr:AsmA family protein [Pseudomonadales bacterium]